MRRAILFAPSILLAACNTTANPEAAQSAGFTRELAGHGKDGKPSGGRRHGARSGGDLLHSRLE